MLLSGSTVCANLLLGPANISDLLDSADNGGHQPDTQPAMEKEAGEQQQFEKLLLDAATKKLAHELCTMVKYLGKKSH